MSSLQTLTQRLRAGLAASGQGTYRRRSPAPAARPDLQAARAGLRELVAHDPSVEAWRALSLAEEAFLNYPAAVLALESAISSVAQPDRKDLKRLFLLRESAAKWQAIALAPAALASLGRELEERLASQPCDHTMRHTLNWLKEQRISSQAKVVRGLEQCGGYCDCEVLFNVV